MLNVSLVSTTMSPPTRPTGQRAPDLLWSYSDSSCRCRLGERPAHCCAWSTGEVDEAQKSVLGTAGDGTESGGRTVRIMRIRMAVTASLAALMVGSLLHAPPASAAEPTP